MASMTSKTVSWVEKRFSFQKFTSMVILASAVLLILGAIFEVVRFYTTPKADALSFQNQTAWLNYSIWRAGLLPASLSLLALAFVTFLLSLAVYPLAPKLRKIFTISMLVFLEEQLAVWGSWLISHVPHPTSLWVYDPFPLLDSVIGESVAVSFLILACATLVTLQITFNSIPRTLQIMSLSLMPLPLYVYFFDRGEFNLHFQDVVRSLSFFTNMDLLIACFTVFTFTTVYQIVRWSVHRR